MLSSDTTAASIPLNWSFTWSGTAMTKAGRFSGPSASGSLRKHHRLRAGRKGALQSLTDEGILVGAEVACAGALAVMADGGQVEMFGVLATKFSSRRVT